MSGREFVREWSGPACIETRRIRTPSGERHDLGEDSKLLAYAIPTDEELLIARDTVRVILGEPHPS